MSVYQEFKDMFDPELRARKEKARLMAAEAERRKRTAQHEAEVGALAASPVIQEYRQTLLDWGSSLMTTENMDAAACYWFRRGLEQAVKVLDEDIAKTEE